MQRTGFGVAALVPHEVLRDLGVALYGLGYDDAWSNDLGPDGPGDGLAALAALGRGAPALRLGLGVAALDKRPPAELAEAVAAQGLADDGRLALGVGAGFSETPVAVVREGIAELRLRLPDDVLVGAAAMGPRMCRLAGELADFVFLNWPTPERIVWARRLVRQGAERAGRDPSSVEVAAYVRVAVGPGAAERLAGEAGRYASMPHYGRHFSAMGVPPGSVGIAVENAAEVGSALDPYREVLDTLVVRALPPEPTLQAHLAIATAARPGGLRVP
jgi:alkanesulfonate monooxygenase SsuD/methylene tetrahydromethanopterin reductase-like flavin-dependent oxidoreductase (luciferase family)